MSYDRFLIAPYDDGMRTDLEPWLIPEQSFQQLSNAYVWRGRVRKRFGGTLIPSEATSSLTEPLYSRLRIQLDDTTVLPIVVASGIVPGASGAQGQQFSIGDVIFTVTHTAGLGDMLRTDNTGEVATFNITTGEYEIYITAAPSTAVYFYPGKPVMGITQYASGAINNHPTLAFDTKWVYQYGNGWGRIGVTEDIYWKGGDTNFFWTCNWEGRTSVEKAMFITNFHVVYPNGAASASDDNLVWYNEDSTPTFKKWQPAVNNAYNILSARIIVPFKNRLVLLNTIEQTIAAPKYNGAHPNRCRYSHNGSPLATNAFIEKNYTGFDGGGYIDAPTDEAIVTVEFIKDRLIVYFERSTWELAYTGNQVLPFVWQKINTELGAESTFSAIPFDTNILAIGNTGVHSCSGSNVQRIDNKIPNEIFNQFAKNPNDIARVAGIRDYYVEMAYWTYSTSNKSTTSTFPNKVLVYNYKNDSWAFNDDCITTFGYYEQQTGTTWSQMLMNWSQNNSTWSSGVNAPNFRQILAGNQQGYTFIVAPDTPMNAPVMSLIDIVDSNPFLDLTIMNHNLELGDYIRFSDVLGTTGLSLNIFQVQAIIDANTIQITQPYNFTGTYLGGGNIVRVSKVEILSKEYNPYIDKGRNVYVAKIDFGVLATEAGSITVDYYASTVDMSILQEGSASGSLLGTGILETFPYTTYETAATRLWHPLYFQSEGECIQLYLYFTDEQMVDPLIVLSDFWLEGMVLHTMPTTSRLQ